MTEHGHRHDLLVGGVRARASARYSATARVIEILYVHAPNHIETRADAIDHGDVATDLRNLRDELREQCVDRGFLLGRMNLHETKVDGPGRGASTRVYCHRTGVRGQLDWPCSNRTTADGGAACNGEGYK